MQEGVASEAVLARRPPRPRPPDRLLRRQQHPARRPGRPGDHRGRGQALRGVRLARASTSATDIDLDDARARDARGDGRGGPAVADHRASRTSATAARTSRTPTKAHGSPLGEDAIRETKETLRLGPGQARSSSRTRRSSTSARRASAASSSRTSGTRAFDAYKRGAPGQGASCSSAPGGRAARRLGRRRCRSSSADEKRDGHPQGVRRGDPVGARARARSWSAARPTSPARTTPTSRTAATSQKGDYGGRNIRFGVREHGMGAIVNGLGARRACAPFGGTFLTSRDYMRGAIRLAALMKLPSIYVYTHDSIGLGEDGPTHQPVEHLAALRAIPRPERDPPGRRQRDALGPGASRSPAPRRRRRSRCRARTCRRSTRTTCPTTRSSAAPTCSRDTEAASPT